MGDSDESFFWDEREEDFASEYVQSNHPFQTADQTFYDEDFGSKKIRFSSDSDHQEGDGDSSSQSSPLGLTLRKTPSFLNLLQKSLFKGKEPADTHPTRRMDDLGSEKLKASNFPAYYIKIGSWERMSRHEGDLTAKLYYAKRKLVWEVLDGALKKKIEIHWSDITAIRAITPHNQPATLEIEVKQPPLFYREINPQPRKHTLWQQASDFTGGQAPIWRRHYVRFPPGVVDKHYEKLLQCDERLLALAQKPFPSHASPYFDPTMFGISQLSLIFNAYADHQYPHNVYTSLPQPPHPTMPAVEYPFTNCSQPYEAPHQSSEPTWEQQLLRESNDAAVMTTACPYTQSTTDVVMPSYSPDITEAALYSHQLNGLQHPPQPSHHHPPFYFQPHNPTNESFF